ncbi:hypothetical protein OGAPHI_002945 [Ogataea philodendri]|uniref:Altered inheritance of mitochondria protein 6 n=1 Tax=Ogataea philodendri TaxID=1378263 RepID=A0A9P8T6V0_9ASCO|nr:uncharacterized protein OGAPHI_002945 [Ogataea philodendri]KAH3667296.1 hypothetical protein OGAPHI_002945 [Ogataea philodendri]
MWKPWGQAYEDLETQGPQKVKRERPFRTLHTHILALMLALAMAVVAIHFYLKAAQLNREFEEEFGPRLITIESLTHDVSIKPIHSHNDEWRRHPLLDALRAGANSIEADCYYRESDPDTILVGHNPSYLSRKANLDAMYLDHLFDLLKQSNAGPDSRDGKNGIFYTSPETTTYFYVDIKNNREQLLEVFQHKLQRFLDNDFLTTYNSTSDTFHEGPLTIIVTGDVPYDQISSQELVYTFIDAPLNELVDPEKAALYPANKISLFASASLGQLTGSHKAVSLFNGLSSSQLADLDKFIKAAHSINLKTRIWDTPKFTKAIKHKVWKQLIELDSDYLNVDDLREAIHF